MVSWKYLDTRGGGDNDSFFLGGGPVFNALLIDANYLISFKKELLPFLCRNLLPIQYYFRHFAYEVNELVLQMIVILLVAKQL